MGDGAGELRRVAPLVSAFSWNEAQVSTPSLGKRLHIVIERMAGEIEADSLELLREPLHRQPRFARGKRDILSLRRRTCRRDRSGRASVSAVVRFAMARMASTPSRTRRAVRLEHIESARLGQAFERPPVESRGHRCGARNRRARRTGRPRSASRTRCCDGACPTFLSADERIEDGAVLHREIDARGVDAMAARSGRQCAAPRAGKPAACRYCPYRATSRRRGTRPDGWP